VISVPGVAFLTARAPDRGRAIAILLGVTTTIRLAVAGDAAAVARIYNEGIEDRLATFETRSRTAEEVAGWLDGGLPFLVAEDGGEVVVGFARVSPYSDRCVYDGVGEHGVYVARSARGAGLGRLLLEALCDEASGAASTSSRAECSPTTSRAAPCTSPSASRRSGSSAATGAWTAAGRTACSSSACSATRLAGILEASPTTS
jgi:L-amino acid N-acyltransferase YncA